MYVEVIIMMILITYDVNTQDSTGRAKLRKVAKKCTNYGVRVQNSVFECIADPAVFRVLKHELSEIIDIDKDSLRFYYLGDKYKTKVEHIGAKSTINVDEPLIL